MTDTEDNKAPEDLRQQIMQRIAKEKVTMKPKLYFMAVAVLLGVGLAATLVTAVLFAAVLSYRLTREAPLEFLDFGSAGISPMLLALPWIPFAVAIVSLSVGVWLLKKYDFAYKRSSLGLAVALVAALALAGAGVAKSGLIEELEEHAPHQLAPLFNYEAHRRGGLVGEIVTLADEELTLMTRRGDTVTVALDDDIHYPRGRELTTGQVVRLIGHWDDDVFEAHGIAPVKRPHVRGLRHEQLRRQFERKHHLGL